MKTLDEEALSRYNGGDGQPTYVAYKGKVYDISTSKRWKDGLHMKRHRAGADLTTDIQAAPHGPEVLERFEPVAVLRKAETRADPRIPAFLQNLLTRFPMLRRHPHPMTVHFPIVFMFSATVFTALYLLTGHPAFDTTAFHCLGGGVLFAALAISTGWYTWWLNYLSKPVRAVTIKKRFSLLMLGVGLTAFIWRLHTPGVLVGTDGPNVGYLLLVLSLFPLVTVIGWFGASLTFPIEGE